MTTPIRATNKQYQFGIWTAWGPGPDSHQTAKKAPPVRPTPTNSKDITSQDGAISTAFLSLCHNHVSERLTLSTFVVANTHEKRIGVQSSQVSM